MVRRLSSAITAGITNYYAYNIMFDGIAHILNQKSYQERGIEAEESLLEKKSSRVLIEEEENDPKIVIKF